MRCGRQGDGGLGELLCKWFLLFSAIFAINTVPYLVLLFLLLLVDDQYSYLSLLYCFCNAVFFNDFIIFIINILDGSDRDYCYYDYCVVIVIIIAFIHVIAIITIVNVIAVTVIIIISIIIVNVIVIVTITLSLSLVLLLVW